MFFRAISCVLIIALALPSAALAAQDPTPAQPSSSTEKPAVAVSSTPASIDKKGPTLEDGTPVKLRIGRTVSSADAKVGDTVDFEVLDEVRVGDLLVIPKSGVAWATVTEAQSKKRMGRGGKLDINIDSVRIADGRKIPLRAVKEMKGGGHVGAMTGAMVATGLVFFPAAPLFLFMHGKDITIPKGTEVTAYINGNVDLEPLVQAANVKVASTQQASTPQQTMLEVASTPAGAEIEIDGAFAGSTPSSIGIATGEHTITIKKSGYKSWERKIKTTSGSVKVTAELEVQSGTGGSN